MAKELEVISLKDVIPGSIAGDKNIQAIIRAADPQLQEVSQNIREAFIISRINELPYFHLSYSFLLLIMEVFFLVFG